MIRKTAIFLSAGIALSILTSCSKPAEQNSTGGFDPSSVKTMKDVFACEDPETYQEAYTETQYVYVFENDGVYYRAYADFSKDMYEAVSAVEFDDPDRDKKVKELIAPLEVKSFENLSEQIPPQEELDKNIGRKGQELFDEGWTYWYYNLEDMEAGLYYGPFAYAVRFAYDGEQMQNTDDFDFYKEFADLEVSSVTFDGLGDASELD